jgi:hypothetical protein
LRIGPVVTSPRSGVLRNVSATWVPSTICHNPAFEADRTGHDRDPDRQPPAGLSRARTCTLLRCRRIAVFHEISLLWNARRSSSIAER